MIRPDQRRALLRFGARFIFVFVVLLLPIPWLPDGYVTVVGSTTNAMLSVVDAGARYGARFEPPASIRKEGSWKANLRVDDRKAGGSAAFHLDMRSFSYRPLATFVALAAATTMESLPRGVALWLGGLLSMFVTTTCFSALPLLSRFAIAGAFGEFPGLLIRTLYQATATPLMVYLLPAFVWWSWLGITKPRRHGTRTQAALSGEASAANPGPTGHPS